MTTTTPPSSSPSPSLAEILALPKTARTQILQEALNAYPALIPTNLIPLDKLRYETIPDLVVGHQLSKEQLLQLVDWKLSHGKFRPALRALVNSNSEETVQDVTRRALQRQFKGGDVALRNALEILVELRGVGPATASLILSCGDPEGVVFFGDEVAGWLFGDWEFRLKYSVKEWMELQARFEEVRGELGLNAMEVEKVGYVFGKRAKGKGGKVEGGKVKGKKRKVGDVAGKTSDGEKAGGKNEEVKEKKKAKVNVSPPATEARRSTRSSSRKTE